MRAVGSRELRSRLGRYLRLVGKGETIIVTERGKPVARLVPLSPRQGESVGVEDVLQPVEAEGHFRRATQASQAHSPKGQTCVTNDIGRPRLMRYLRTVGTWSS